MTRLEIATLACKILAIWLLAQVAMGLASILLVVIVVISSAFGDSPFRSGDFTSVLLPGVIVAAQLGIALFLWYKAPRLAGRMVSSDPTPATAPNLNQEAIMAVACVAVGLFNLIPTLQSVARQAIRLAGDKYNFSDLWRNPDWHATFWPSILGLAFSLWMIFGARGIVRIIRWARQAMLKRDFEETAEE